MSGASPMRSQPAAENRQRFGAQTFQRVLGPIVSFVGFWTAVIAPIVLLALLLSGHVAQYPLVATGLLACNVAGILLGQDYGR